MAELVEKSDELTKLSQEVEEKVKVSKELEKKEVDNDDDEGEGDDDDEEDGEDGAGKKKKKNRKKKKKPAKKKTGEAAATGTTTFVNAGIPAGIAPLSRLLGGSTDYFVKYGQTNPPTIPVKDLFPQGGFPTGEILPHGKTKYPDPNSSWARQTEEEKR